MNTVEKLYQEGCLENCKLLLFTDNIVADYAYHKSTSSSKMLFNLVLRLIKFQLKGDFILHLIHILGYRMIDCVVDTLSRGCPTTGLMREDKILFFYLYTCLLKNEVKDWFHGYDRVGLVRKHFLLCNLMIGF